MDTVGSREAARLLHVGQVTIQRWCHAGLLSGAYLVKRSRRLGWRIPRTSVMALLEAAERETLQIGLPS